MNTHKNPLLAASLRPMRVRAALIVIVVLFAQFMPNGAYAVSSWNPTLLVNTESFERIDSGDGTSTVDLQFGSSTSALKFLTNGTFQFNKSLSVVGGISGSYLTIDHQANISGALLVKGTITSRSTISGANLTFMGATNSYILGNLGIGKSGTPNTKLEVVGTVSGTTINANSLLTGSTLQGFGLYNCQGSANKLTYNATTKRFLCEADQTSGGGGSNWSNTGSLQNAFDMRFVNQHGDTMTGALTIRTSTTQSATGALNVLQQTHATGAYIKSSTNKEPALAIDIVGTPNAPHLLFGYQGVFDTNLYRGTANLLKTSGSFFALGTISGSVLRVSNSADIHGPLSVSGAIRTEASVSGAYLTFMGATSSYILGNLGIGKSGTINTKLEVVGTISGTTLNANSLLTGSTLQGFGLYNCQGSANKLTYNSTTKKFLCEADQGGAGGGISYATASGIFLKRSGGALTGALMIDYATDDIFTLSGGVMHHGAYGVPALLSGANIGTNVRDIYVSGKYAFVGQESISGPDVRIFDIHNRAAPTYIAGIDVGANVNKLLHVGKYLYVGTSTIAGTCTRDIVTGCEFRIYDVSNLSSPLAIGGVNIGVGVNDLQVVGELVYLANDTVAGTCNASTGATINGCELQVYDVSNPYAPQPIGGVNDTVDARALYVSGGQVYVAYDSDSGAGNELKIFSILNHSSLTSLGGINAGVAALNFNSIIVSGRYAYIGTSVDASTCSGSTVTGCEFRIYDTGNPSSPTAVSGLSFDVGVNSLDIAAGTVFAGLASSSTTELKTIDVSAVTTPVTVGGREMGIGINSVAVAGKYIYVGSDAQTGLELHLLDAPGIEAPTATIGSIQGSSLTITESARVNNSLFVGNGLNVGRGGVNLRGALSVQSTSTGSLYTGLDIKNSTGTMMFSVRDDGFADAGRGVTGYNGYLGQEFNDEKAAITADGVAWGDNLNWVSDVSTTTCSFSVPEAWPSATRSQITTASTGCNLYMGLANADPMNFINSTGSLARVLVKVRLNSATATAHSFIGLAAAWPANNVAEPGEGIYFTGSGGTTWQGTVNNTTGVSTYVTCPGATIQTGFGKFALLDITTESPTRVRFRVDPDTTDGINFINCGTANPTGVKNMLGVGATLATTAAFTGTAQQDIDFIRVWAK